ncbi:MAG TPA: GGDEF domain-containing protein [Burkholderiales bacterium]|nr:GGDEF domain-containing protein [Burkholderiales bacterium]
MQPIPPAAPPKEVSRAADRIEPPAGKIAARASGYDIEASELRDFSRTVAEIEWLLVILVLFYYVFRDPDGNHAVAIYSGLIAFTAVILALHYLNLVRRPGRWLLAIETWIMIVFITWVLYHTGRLDSPLLNLYLLPIVTSALTLGQLVTLLQMGLVAACYLLLGYSTNASFFSALTAGDFAADLAPMLLVAYITTMLSQDILNAMARLRLISETDELTGAYNARAFNAIARREAALAARYRRFFSLLMIDSDNLKAVNDTHGHEAGDALIRHVAQCIRGELRTTDIAARYGGDEFVCLLPETPAPGAALVAERIRRRVADTPFTVDGTGIRTSVSIGVAALPEHGTTLELLARNADRALYAAKAQGRNRVAVFAPG